MKSAKRFLDDSKFLLSDDRYEPAFGSAYIAAFNAAKALLYGDGIDERSHACAILYLKSKYQKEFGHLLNIFDDFRKKRHSIQYAGSHVSELELRDYVDFAGEFIGKAESLVKIETRTED